MAVFLNLLFNGVRRVGCTCLIAAALLPIAARAEFELNFQIQNQGSAYNDGYWTTSAYHSIGVETWAGDEAVQDQTPWVHTDSWHLPEIVYDPQTGKRYYHILFGDMADGFTQEVFIETAASSHGGWHDPGDKNTPGSSSGGEGDYYVGANGVTDNRGTPIGGNAADPLNTDPNVDAGNGSGNPRKVIMRQIVSDGEIMMEFYKDKYANKPRISQMINAPDMMQFVEMDMTHMTYDDNSVAAPMINETWLFGEGIPDERTAYFDAMANAHRSNVNAGQFTFTEGGGPGGANGQYEYVDGGFDHEAVEWGLYFDESLYNPWSHEAAKDALP